MFEFTGIAEDSDELNITLDGGLVIQGGGIMRGNKLSVSGLSLAIYFS